MTIRATFDGQARIYETSARVLPADHDAARAYLARPDSLDLAPILGIEVPE